MTELYPSKTDANERCTYEPVLSRITGTSQYRDDEYRLEGIEGFWMAGKVQVAQAVKDGAVAWFQLATKPKSGNNAKPGSMYRDIVTIRPATPDDKASYDPAAQTIQSYAAKETLNNGSGHPGANNGMSQPPLEQRILLGMAFNNLTVMLGAALFDPSDGTTSDGDMIPSEHAQMMAQWRKWFSEASRGLPLTPVQDAPADAPPAADDSAAEDGQTMEVTELPW